MPNSRHSCWQLATWEVVRMTGNLMPFKCIIYYCPSHHKQYIYKNILKAFQARRKRNLKNKLPPVLTHMHKEDTSRKDELSNVYFCGLHNGIQAVEITGLCSNPSCTPKSCFHSLLTYHQQEHKV